MFTPKITNRLKLFFNATISVFALVLLGAAMPQASAATNCGALNMFWSIGPNASTDYIDVCYINMGTGDVDDDFVINDISTTGIKNGSNINWAGGDCSTYARVTTKNCSANITGNCAWVGIQTSPIAGQNNGGYTTNPVAHVRYPSGAEADIAMGSGGYNYSDCAPPPAAPTCTLSASPTSITQGGTSNLRLTTSGNVTTRLINQGIGFAVANTDYPVTPASTTVYTATLIGPGGTGTCSATVTVDSPINGTCGADHGQTLAVAPTNLCNAGTASAVNGTGPWTWTCLGLNGGTNANCSANIENNGTDNGSDPTPEGNNCGALNMFWAIGPNASTDYIDVCYINMGTGDVDDDFVINDISTTGTKNGSNINWAGSDCSSYSRITTKNCGSAITGDCAWVGIQTSPIAGQNNGGYTTNPVAHVRYPSGAEANIAMGDGGYAYQNCAPPSTAPTCTLSASPTSITQGGTSNLRLTTSGNVTTRLINQGIGFAVANTDYPVTPASTTVYTATLIGPGGTGTCSATVTVDSPINGTCGADHGQTLAVAPTNLCNAGTASAVNGTGPWTWTCLGLNGGNNSPLCSATQNVIPTAPTCNFTNPDFQTITAGQSTNIAWAITGDTTSVVLTPGNVNLPLSPYSVSPTTTTTYTLTVGSAAGSNTCQTTVNIQAPTPSCTISASPTTINQGGNSTISWNSSNSTSASLNQGIGGVATAGSQVVSPANSTSYTLTVNGPGGSSNCSTPVTVNPPVAIYDLAVSVHVDDTTVAPNILTNPNNPVYTDLTYDITYRNIGNTTMTSIVVTEDYDQTRVQILTAPGATDNGDVLTWNIPTLNAGGSGTFTYEARLFDAVGGGESIVDAVHIESTTPGMQLGNEANQANNDDSTTVDVSAINGSAESKRVTNLNTGITSTAVHAVENDTLEYTLSYTAITGADEAGVMIIDNDPNFESIFLYANLVDPGLGTFTDNDGDGLIDIATFGPFDIPAFQTQEVRFRVQVKANLVGIGGDYTLRNSYGNDVTVVSLPNLAQNKFVSVDGAAETQNDSAVPGSTLDYRLSVTNTGGSDQNGFVFEDDITDILEYTTITNANGGTVSTNAQGEEIISWAPTTIPAGGTVNRTFTATVDNPLVAGGDYTLRNVYGNAVTVVTIPDLVISKRVSNANNGQNGQDILADENHILTYTLSASSALGYSNYVFTDDVTDILEYANVLNISNGGVLAGGVITWPQTNVAAGTTVDRTFEADVNPAAGWPNGAGFDRTMTNVFGNIVTVALPGSVNETDLHIEKTVVAENVTTPPSGGAGTDVSYTITYRNEGNLDATVTRIIDSYDNVNLTNIRNVVMPAGVTVVDDGIDMTFTIGNLAIGASGTITYDATISNAAPHGQDIINTANILSAEVDGDATDNQASALVRVASLQVDINKTSNLAVVGNNQTVTYTITVTNREATAETVVITDTIANTGVINGSNGGTMTLNAGSSNVVFGGSGALAGSIENPAGLTLIGIESNRNVTITYTATSSYAGIPTNGSSNATNVATLSYQGSGVYTSVRTVVINGPSGGGSSSSSSSGGSSSSSSGGGVYKTTDPEIQKLVSINGGAFTDADLPTSALLLGKNKNNLVTYKITVSNPSQMDLEDIQIEDVYDIQNSRISQIAMRNVRGADYTNGIFTIDEIEENSQKSFTYQATLNTNGAITNSSAFNQVKILDYTRTETDVQGTKRTGQMDRAYVIIAPDAEDRLLYKYSNKSVINDRDEIEYTIIVKNIYDYDLRNVIITDNYDEAHLEIISSPGINDGSTLQFKRTIIRPGQSFIFRYTAKGINKTKEAIDATNSVRIFSDSADLSNEIAQRTVTIYPFGARLAQTGTGGMVVLTIIALAGAAVITRRRKVYS